MKFDPGKFLLILVRVCQFWLKLDENNGDFLQGASKTSDSF
jgi:hypothetical protein